ncbi:MAG TPA: GNAT family N-acetyltransferase [Herpetosiphonaceae bacterium]|nr:GNAT family N-acetyltransferase [Herpetosiphonaceae bacterium]
MLDVSAAFATFPVLETERFVLRPFTADDTDATFRIMSDPQVTRYFGRFTMTERAHAVERIERIQAAFAERRGIRWAIAPRQGGELIGSCGFWRIDAEHFRAEIGYELAPEVWGRGVMPEALQAALGFGFAKMRLHSVEANIDPANTGSRRVLEKLGFAQEGYFRENYYIPDEDRFSDTATFSLLSGDWRRPARG